MISGLEIAFMHSAPRPAKMMRIVAMRGKVGRVLMVKRRCGWTSANKTIKIAR